MVSTKKSSLEELYAFRDFFFPWTYSQEKKSSFYRGNFIPFSYLLGYKYLCSHSSGKGRVPGKEDMFLGRFTALIRRKGLAQESHQKIPVLRMLLVCF